MNQSSYFHVSHLPDNVCRAPATLSHLENARTFHLKNLKSGVLGSHVRASTLVPVEPDPLVRHPSRFARFG